MEKVSTWLIYTQVSGNEAYSTGLRGTLADRCVQRLRLFPLTVMHNPRAALICMKPKVCCTFVGSVLKKKIRLISHFHDLAFTTLRHLRASGPNLTYYQGSPQPNHTPGIIAVTNSLRLKLNCDCDVYTRLPHIEQIVNLLTTFHHDSMIMAETITMIQTQTNHWVVLCTSRSVILKHSCVNAQCCMSFCQNDIIQSKYDPRSTCFLLLTVIR